MLLAVPRATHEPRSFTDAVEWLRAHGRDFVAWNVAYDAHALLAWLPRPVLRRLALGRAVTVRGPVRGRSYRVTYVPRKRLTVTAAHWTGGGLHVRDAAVWYGSSLDAAAVRWLGKGKLPIPRSWLADMRVPLARPRTARLVKLYARRDAALAARLWRRAAAGFAKLGLDIARTASPAGAAAQRWRAELRAAAAAVPPTVHDAFARAYFGGRFEAFELGRVADLSVFDLRSAYPWAYSTLPALGTAPAIRRIAPGEPLAAVLATDPAAYVVAHVAAAIPLGLRAGPVPVRQADGLVVFPVGRVVGWFTRPDLRALAACGAKVDVLDGWTVHPADATAAAFPGIPAMYADRVAAVERGDADLALALKLTLNGLYGKTCERRERFLSVEREAHEHAPAALRLTPEGVLARKAWPANTASFVLAATATALVRERLWREVPWHRCVFVATDSMALRGDARPIPHLDAPADGLGAWSAEGEGVSGLVLGNGVYWLGEEKARTRGARRFDADAAETLLGRARSDATRIVLPAALRAASLADSARRDDWEAFNVLLHEERALQLDADRKRYWTGPRTAGRLRRGRAVQSLPWVWTDGLVDPRSLVRRRLRAGRDGGVAGD